MSDPIVVVRQPHHSTLFLLLREALVIGRECEGLQLADPRISRRHLLLEARAGSVRLADLGSTNGTQVDGRDLVGAVDLRPGQIVQLGACTLELLDAPSPPPASGITLASLDDGLRVTAIDLLASAAVTEPPSHQPDDAGTVTIVFCDIEGSTNQAVALGDVRWMEVLDVHNSIIRRQVTRFRGREVKAQGDGFMLSFPSARSAIDAMREAQRALALWAGSRPADAVRVRVGVHTGEVLVGDGGDLFGKHVVIAARVANAARGGEILVSSLVREIVESRGDVEFEPSRTVALKGIGDDVVVHPVRWSAG